MSSTSPTQRTLARLRDLGYRPAIVEHWNPHAKIRQDMYGFVDIVSCGRGEPVRFIQTTSADHHAERQTKIDGIDTAALLHRAGVLVEVWSWGKKGARGKVKSWTLRVTRMVGMSPERTTWTDASHEYGEAA